MIYNKVINCTPKVTLCLFICIYIVQTVTFNLNLSNARYELHMDEQISFDGVKDIYQSPLKDITSTLRDEGDHRYGRVFWNTLALFSWPSYYFFKDKGLIISNRIILAIIQLMAYLILLYFFVTNEWLKCIGLSFLILLPTTTYYAHMPKPEPIQLFFLSLFLINRFTFKRNSLSFLFLGVAFGAKISLLPGVIFIFIFDLIKYGYNKINHFFKNLVIFLIGLIIGEPILSYFTIGRFLIYYNATFSNIGGHESDRPSIDSISWLDFFHRKYFSNQALSFYPIGTIALILISITLIIFISKSKQYFSSYKNFIDHTQKRYIYLLIISLSFLLPVFFFINRLWAHYLHIGLVLMIISFLNFYSQNHQTISRHLKKALLLLAAGFIFMAIPLRYRDAINLSSRTESPAYKSKIALWEKLKDMSLLHTKEGDRVCIDPRMFYDKIFQQRQFTPFWGRFNFDKRSLCRIITMYNDHLTQIHSKESPLYEKSRKFKTQYKDFVDNEICPNNCYKRIFLSEFPNVFYLIKTKK